MTASIPIYQLKVTLQGSRPPIWRRVQVPSTMSLEQLHLVIQFAMDWGNCHLHEFEIGGQTFGQPMPDFEDMGILNERGVQLHQVIPGEKFKFSYLYDMGDGWDHQVLVEKILPPDPRVVYPICLKGKRACPPEDCGGIWGYMDLLEILKDPQHPDHKEMLEWVGGEIDPEDFDLEEANRRLDLAR